MSVATPPPFLGRLDSHAVEAAIDKPHRIDGLVYFPKQAKRYQDLVITFRVGWLTFEFPWSPADR
jgi:hypothetical protein